MANLPGIITVKRYVCITFTGLVSVGCLFSCANKKTGEISVTASTVTDTAIVSALIAKASSYVQTNIDSMHLLADSAIRQASAIHFKKGIAKAKAVEANYHRLKGNYTAAISLGLEVINIYDSMHLFEDRVRMQNMLANIYKDMGEDEGTLEFSQKGLQMAREAQQLAEREKYNMGIALSLNMQGIILRDISKRSERKDLMDTALVLYQKALSIIQQTGDGEGSLGRLYNNISQVYNERLKDYPTALEYLFRAVEYNKERNNLASLSFNYNNISSVYLEKKNLKEAKRYAHQMMDVCAKLKAPHRTVNAYWLLARITKQMHEFDSALYYTEESSSMTDSLNNVEKTGQIAEMQTKYETTEKQEQINQLNRLSAVKNQRFWLLAGVAGLLALLVAMFLLQNRRLQLQKKQIAEQSDRLQWMMKELHHRVKNNLQIVSSLLNLQSYRLKDEESISAIKESQLRVQAMSLMHQRLYQVEDVSMVNFKLYLDDLAETLMRAYGYGPDDFDLRIEVEEELLDVDTVMPMGLLVNEIITNSFKYAYKDVGRPSLTIHLGAGDKQLKLEIADNGPGMIESANNKNGFGKKLISALTQQLKASYTLDVSKGTAYIFNIPYTPKKAA
jgi:two-component sensor histidine kinase/tetratricopeptide (TPR) repeat protein